MKKTKTLFDQAIEIIEAGGDSHDIIFINYRSKYYNFLVDVLFSKSQDDMIYLMEVGRKGLSVEFFYTRLLLARELWNDGQEKYWEQGLFK